MQRDHAARGRLYVLNIEPRALVLRSLSATPPEGAWQFGFAIPHISGLGLIEMPTTSIYVLQKAHAAMQTVAMARGRLVGAKFWMSKQELEISRIDDTGKPVRQMQWLITLDAEIDIAALLDGSDRRPPALEMAEQAVSMLEEDREVPPDHGSADDGTIEAPQPCAGS